VGLLQRNLDDLRLMLPPPDAKTRRGVFTKLVVTQNCPEMAEFGIWRT